MEAHETLCDRAGYKKRKLEASKAKAVNATKAEKESVEIAFKAEEEAPKAEEKS